MHVHTHITQVKAKAKPAISTIPPTQWTNIDHEAPSFCKSAQTNAQGLVIYNMLCWRWGYQKTANQALNLEPFNYQAGALYNYLATPPHNTMHILTFIQVYNKTVMLSINLPKLTNYLRIPGCIKCAYLISLRYWYICSSNFPVDC